MKAIAAWAIERGAEIIALEQLLGSRAIGSTFVTQLRLKLFNLSGLLLILLCCLHLEVKPVSESLVFDLRRLSRLYRWLTLITTPYIRCTPLVTDGPHTLNRLERSTVRH